MTTQAIIPFILAVLAGASVVTQQVLNANLRAELNSAAWSGFVSYFLGVICMALLAIALRDPVPSAGTKGVSSGGRGLEACSA
jgi:transporter family-2 protein